eukprot:1665811-Amphidinium_carterae.1
MGCVSIGSGAFFRSSVWKRATAHGFDDTTMQGDCQRCTKAIRPPSARLTLKSWRVPHCCGDEANTEAGSDISQTSPASSTPHCFVVQTIPVFTGLLALCHRAPHPFSPDCNSAASAYERTPLISGRTSSASRAHVDTMGTTSGL